MNQQAARWPCRIRHSLFALALACATAVSVPAQANVFSTPMLWERGPDGLVTVGVCITSDSSVHIPDGEIPWWAKYLVSDPPSLALVVDAIRGSATEAFEQHSAVRFVGWGSCDLVEKKSDYVAISIKYDNPSAAGRPLDPNNYRSIVTLSPFYAAGGTRFAPWQIACLFESGDDVFSCIRQYGAHELGHSLGFLHSMHHPLVTDECREDLAPDTADLNYLVYTDTYDRDSLMAYGGEQCVDQSGWRFGSPTTSDQDRELLQRVYPVVALDAATVPGRYRSSSSGDGQIVVDGIDYRWEGDDGQTWPLTNHMPHARAIGLENLHSLRLAANAPAPYAGEILGKDFEFDIDGQGHVLGFEYLDEYFEKVFYIEGEMLPGFYTRHPHQNGFHTGQIEHVSGNTYRWTNCADATWELFFQGDELVETGTEGNPYAGSPGGDAFVLDVDSGGVNGFWFLDEFYKRSDNPPVWCDF